MESISQPVNDHPGAAQLFANQWFVARDDNSAKIFAYIITGDRSDQIFPQVLSHEDFAKLSLGNITGVDKDNNFLFPLPFPKHKAHIELPLFMGMNLRGVAGNTKDIAIQNFCNVYKYASDLSGYDVEIPKDYDALTIPQLKKFCLRNNLDITGCVEKKDLVSIARLFSSSTF